MVDIRGLDFLTACLFSYLVFWNPSLSSSPGLRTAASSFRPLLKHRPLLLGKWSYVTLSVYLVELSVIFPIQNACKRKQCHFLLAGFLKSHVGKNIYYVFHMNRKLSVMTAISASTAASPAVDNVIVNGKNRVGF